MHARAVTCRMCKSKFFPASLKFHTKVCAEKQDHIDLPCDYCQKKFPPTVLQTNRVEKHAPCVETFKNSHERQTHMKTCKRDSRRAQSTRGMGRRCQDPVMTAKQRSVEGNYNVPAAGAFSARRRQQQQQLPIATTTLCARKKSSSSPLLCSHASDIELGPQQTSIDDGEHCRHFENVGDVGDVVITSSDGRVACSNCNRRFSFERVGVHQEICERVNTEENRERHRTKKGVGSNVRSATPRPHRSASGYGAARRRRRAQELPPGREHNQTHRDFGGSDKRLVIAAAYSSTPRATSELCRGAASPEPRASSIHPVVEKMTKREESGHRRWSQTENRRPVGTPRAARRGVAQRERPSSAFGWVSSTAKQPTEGSRETSNTRAASSSWSPVRLDRGASVTVWSTRGVVDRAARRASGGSGGGGGGGGGVDSGHQSGGRRHVAVRDGSPFLRDIRAMSETAGGVRERARCDMPPQTAFFSPPGARRKIPFL